LHHVEQDFRIGQLVSNISIARSSLMISASSASWVSCHHANGLNQNTARLNEASSST